MKRSEAKKQKKTDEKPEDESVEDISKKLKSEMQKSAENEAAAENFDFDHANRPEVEPMRPDLDKVIESIFVNDIHETWQELEAGLRVGEKRSEAGVMLKALDEAETNARKAHRLFITAKIAHEEWEKTNEPVFGAIWNRANRELQEEKDSGQRSKQITDADVRAKAAVMYPDQWKAQEVKRARAKATVESLSHLSDTWLSRCASLQKMYGKSR